MAFTRGIAGVKEETNSHFDKQMISDNSEGSVFCDPSLSPFALSVSFGSGVSDTAVSQ